MKAMNGSQVKRAALECTMKVHTLQASYISLHILAKYVFINIDVYTYKYIQYMLSVYTFKDVYNIC